MSLAADARDMVRERPYLLTALCADAVNYVTVTAELDLGGDGAVAAALHWFTTDLPPLETDPRNAAVTMRSGVGLVGEDVKVTGGEPVLSVTGVDLAGNSPFTAIIAEGEVDPTVLATVLSRFDTKSVVVDATDVASDTLAMVVPCRQGATALRIIETTANDLYA